MANRLPAQQIGAFDTTTNTRIDTVGDNTNKAIRVNVVAATTGTADGAILDGVTSSIRANVLSLTNSKPLTVAVVDSAGTQVVTNAGAISVSDDNNRRVNELILVTLMNIDQSLQKLVGGNQ